MTMENCSSDESISGLRLSCSFSSVEELSVEQESEESVAVVEPYQFESQASERSPNVSDYDDDSQDEGRLLNTYW